MGPRTDPEAIERRRMQNRLAQRKRRLKKAQMAKEEKERQQRLRAAHAASQLTFINDAYMPTNHIPQPQQPLPKEQPLSSPNLFDYPSSYDELFYSSYFPSPQSYDSDTSPFFNNEYPSPSLSYAPSTPALSLYTPSLDEDLSGSFDLDPGLYLESSTGQHALDAFGLTPLPSTPSPRLQPERHRSTSLPTPPPPRSVPTSTPPHIDRGRAPSTASMHNFSMPNAGHVSYYHSMPSTPGSTNVNGKLGLYFGPEQASPNMAHMLMGHGADVETFSARGGRIPLHYAVRSPPLA